MSGDESQKKNALRDEVDSQIEQLDSVISDSDQFSSDAAYLDRLSISLPTQIKDLTKDTSTKLTWMTGFHNS